MAKELGGSVRISTESEEALAFKTLFPSTNAFQRLQMITEIQPKAVVPLSVLGVIRRLYGGSGNMDILKAFQEEFSANRISLDRKGRLEASEIVAAVRSKNSEDSD